MKRTSCRTVLVLGAALLAPFAVAAQEEPHPFELSLFSPIQIFGPEESIAGIRLGLYSRNVNVQGLDVGVVEHTTGMTQGVQFGFVGLAEGGFQGFQNNWAVNVSGGRTAGFQLGLYNDAAEGEVFQLGIVNRMGMGKGFMLGIVNLADDFEGLQIGIVNVIRLAENHAFLPIVNWRFR